MDGFDPADPPSPASDAPAAAEPTYTAAGCVDFYGYSDLAAGWYAGGWVGRDWQPADTPPAIRMAFAADDVVGQAMLCLHAREDVRHFGHGFVLFVGSNTPDLVGLEAIVLQDGVQSCRLLPTIGTVQADEVDVQDRVRHGLLGAKAGPPRTRLQRLLDRPVYDGVDTVGDLPWPLLVELDTSYVCPPHGLVVKGWLADPFNQMLSLRLRSGHETFDFTLEKAVPIARPDVLDALGASHGSTELRCGFLVFAPTIFAPGRPVCLEIDTKAGDVAFRLVARPGASGLVAIRDLLGSFDLAGGELDHAIDTCVGPAVLAMNRARLQAPVRQSVSQFGAQPTPVRATLVIMLDRVDDMECQLAFFARTLAPDHAVIYVLDDCAAARGAETLAASIFARFARPFTLVALSHSRGAGPARNIGLQHARGHYVCFLDSDVFPDTPDWLEDMLDHAADAIVGGVLLFEDGTVQHDGWDGDGRQPHRGLLPGQDTQARPVHAVTAACMLMARTLVTGLHGFDEDYVLDGPEDVDLCQRARAAGFDCLIEPRARLFHLDRGGQAPAPAWRRNLAAVNAWRLATAGRDHH